MAGIPTVLVLRCTRNINWIPRSLKVLAIGQVWYVWLRHRADTSAHGSYSWNMPLPHPMPWMSTPPLLFLLSPTPRLQLPSPLFHQCQASKIFLTTRPLLAVPIMTFPNPKTAGLHPLKGPQNPRRAGAVRERSAFSIVHRPPWILPQVFSSWSVLQTSRKSPCLVVLECHLMITRRAQGSQSCLPWFHHPTHRSLVHPHHRETTNV